MCSQIRYLEAGMQRITFLFCLAVLSLGDAGSASAQEVSWRHDYAAARKEANESGRPILMDIGTETCGACRRLDATTFRDPKLVKHLNEKFIPLKVDANREERLVQSLGIECYPTLVLASPEGKVLGRQVGYADVGQIMVLLAKAPSRQEKAPAQAPIAPVAPAVVEVSAAGVLFAQARAEYDAGRYAECLCQCNSIIAGHSSTPEAQEARRLGQRIANDPNASRLLKEQINSALATLQPQIAASLQR